MPNVLYGNKTIEYSFLKKEGLKSHYITVSKYDGVVLKGKEIPNDKAEKLILNKAKWILDKVKLVSSIIDDDIVTGSRIQYLGRKYYVELLEKKDLKEIEIDFTESKFKVLLSNKLNTQENLKSAFENYFRSKAYTKISPRIKRLSKETGLVFNELQVRKLEKRWGGSCTPSNKIIINIDAIKLPYSLIDYLLVHELVHTKN